MKPVYFFASSQQRIKYSIFFLSITFLSVIFCTVLRFCYESCIVLYVQTKNIYTGKKQLISTIEEREIVQLKQRVAVKVQEKKKYQKILQKTHELFHNFTEIKDILKGAEGTLIRCSLSSRMISLTAEHKTQNDINLLLDQLHNKKQFSAVRLQTTEKLATNGKYICTIAITPLNNIN